MSVDADLKERRRQARETAKIHAAELLKLLQARPDQATAARAEATAEGPCRPFCYSRSD